MKAPFDGYPMELRTILHFIQERRLLARAEAKDV